jgi:hypothetical protein
MSGTDSAAKKTMRRIFNFIGSIEEKIKIIAESASHVANYIDGDCDRT